MKRIVANMSLAGSLLITAAVLAPLFQNSAQISGKMPGMSLLLEPESRELAMVTSPLIEVGSRSSIDTGLLFEEPESRFAQYCSKGGLGSDLICSVFEGI